MPQDSTTLSFTVTTTSNYQATTGGPLAVGFDSIQLTQAPPQAYSFGLFAKTYPTFWITNIHWVFGDGSFKDVPYCCQSQVSEVQYHAYSTPGQYTVFVVAYDNAGNFGTTQVTVNWATPIPEYPSYGLPLMASILVLFVALASLRKLKSTSIPTLRL
jgi:PKD repeat protein